MPLQDLADSLPGDPELSTQLVDRRACLVALDEVLYLLVLELTCPARLLLFE